MTIKSKQTEAFFKENSLSPKARWWELLAAILFGQKHVTEDNGLIITIYIFRNAIYLVRIYEKRT